MSGSNHGNELALRRFVIVCAACAMALLAVGAVGVVLARAEAWFVGPVLAALWIVTGLGTFADGLRATGRAIREEERTRRGRAEKERRRGDAERREAEGCRKQVRKLSDQLALDLANLAYAPALATALNAQKAAAVAEHAAVVKAEAGRGKLLRLETTELEASSESGSTTSRVLRSFRAMALSLLAGLAAGALAAAVGAAVTEAIAVGLATTALGAVAGSQRIAVSEDRFTSTNVKDGHR